MRLIIDNRIGVHNQDDQTFSPDKTVALELLDKLDGNRHTLLSLERSDGWQLMVGGGAVNYIATLGNGAENLTLENIDGNRSKEIELCAGGQLGQFSERLCVNHRQAIEIISLFYDKQEKRKKWV